MKFSLKSLDSLADKHKKVLVFDCEFWHILGEEGDKKIRFQADKDFFFTPREIGGFLLEKVGNEWKLNKPFFVTFGIPLRDIVLPISKYSTVTHETAHKLDDIEKNLGLPWGDAFQSRLSTEGQKYFKEGMKIYKNDENIKLHHKPYSWYKKFMEVYSESLIIVKGVGDIEALYNASVLHDFSYKQPSGVVDIAQWNSQSIKLCKTAKLAGTFDCIKKDLDEEIKQLGDHLPLEKAHDPSTDASMTLLIALYIQSQKP
jgi:hypothetical protein